MESVKTQYTEEEAARELGWPVDRLRALICERILAGGPVPHSPVMKYQPSDLVLFRLLAGTR